MDATTEERRSLERLLQSKTHSPYEFRPSANPDKADPLGGRFCMQILIRRGDLASVEIYLQNGASPNPMTILWKDKKHWEYDWFPLLWAVTSGHTETIKLLVKYGADVNAIGSNVVMATRDVPAYQTHIWKPECRRDYMALRAAVEQSNLDMVETLLELGANPDAHQSHHRKIFPWTEYRTALFCETPVLYDAVARSDSVLVELLLSHGASAKLPTWNNQDSSYLYTAVCASQLKIVTLLLQYGADPNDRRERWGSTPLIAAVQSKTRAYEMAESLIQYGARVDLRQVEEGENDALTFAIRQGRADIVRLLLMYGAKATAVGEYPAPLQIAVKWYKKSPANVEIVRLLLDYGAQPNDTKTGELEPLWVAVQKKKTDVASLLIERGAHVEIVHGKASLLKLAVESDQEDMVELLINSGASTSVCVFSTTGTGHSSCSSVSHLSSYMCPPRIFDLIQRSTQRESNPSPQLDNQPLPNSDEEKMPLPTSVQDNGKTSTVPRLDPIRPLEQLKRASASRAGLTRFITSAKLQISKAVCHVPASSNRSFSCEWELVANAMATDARVPNHIGGHREFMKGGVVLASGRTGVFTPCENVSGGTFVTWFDEPIRLTTATVGNVRGKKSMVPFTEKTLASPPQCLRTCKLRFTIKASTVVPGMSEKVGTAWFLLWYLDETAPSGTKAAFITELVCKEISVGSLSFEITC